MGVRRRPAQEKAAQFLEGLLTECRRQRRYRLPTAKELAALAHVGPVAMLKALRTLTASGDLDARPRQGIVVASARTQADLAPVLEATARDAHLAQWERVYGRIQRDLLNGVYAAGEVCPSGKQLAERYGTSYETLRRALDRLVVVGALAPHKRGFRVPLPTVGRPGASVMLFARGGADGTLDVAFPRSAEALRTVDTECSRRNLGLRMFGLSDTEQPLLGTHAKEVERLCRGAVGGAGVLGCLLFSSGLGPRRVETLALRLASLGKPLSLLDDSSGLQLPHTPASLIRVFRATDTQGASHRLGRYLLQLGHRCVVYVSPTHAGTWSQERLAGLCAAFAEAGVADGVMKVTCDTVSQVAQARGEGVSAEDIASKAAAALAGQQDEACRLASRTFERMKSQAGVLMEAELLSDIERDLFLQALSCRQATAWVASSDYVAARALAFLRGRGVAVPGAVSVAGFDDSMEAFVHGITSYNFDMLSVVRAMLGHVLNPLPPPAAARLGPVTEIGGFITERKTTGKARGRGSSTDTPPGD